MFYQTNCFYNVFLKRFCDNGDKGSEKNKYEKSL
jgi:hypothetical protein